MHTFIDIPKVRREFVLDLAVILHREISRVVSRCHDTFTIASCCEKAVEKGDVHRTGLCGDPMARELLIRAMVIGRVCPVANGRTD